jgi:hypothetical protein
MRLPTIISLKEPLKDQKENISSSDLSKHGPSKVVKKKDVWMFILKFHK